MRLRQLTSLSAVPLAALLLAACPDADAAEAPAGLTAYLQQATDSTAVVTLDWSPPTAGGPVDLYRWRLAGQQGTVDSTAVSVEIPRRDTAYQLTPEVRAEGPGGASPWASVTVQIPARNFAAPGAPEGLDATVDTTTHTALRAPDMPAEVGITEVSRDSISVDYRATWTCPEGAERFVVRAGSNSGLWSYTDTISAEACDPVAGSDRRAVVAFFRAPGFTALGG